MNLSAALPTPEAKPAFRKWTCAVCDYVYDEARGDPDHGLPPGTRFDAIADDWSCPDCGVTKADFFCLDDCAGPLIS